MRGYLFKSATTGIVNVLGSAAITLSALPLLISTLGFENYGIWALLGIFVSSAAVLDLGMTRAIVHLVPRELFSARELLSASLTIAIIAATLLFAIGWLANALAFELLSFPRGMDPELQSTVILAGCVILLCCVLSSILRGFLEAAYAAHVVNVGYLLLTALQYGIALLVARLSGSIEMLLLAATAVHIVVLLFHAVALAARSGLLLGAVRMAVIASLLRQSLSCFAAGSPTVILLPILLFWLAAVAASPAEYGRFDMALKFATMAGTALTLIAVPIHAIVAGMRQPSWADIRRLLRQYLLITLSVLACGWALFGLIGRQLLEFVAGTASGTIWWACAYMLAGVGLLSALEPIQRVLMGLSRFRYLFAVRAMVLVTTLAALALLYRLPVLDRFSIGYALGCGAGAALAVLMLFKIRGEMSPRRAATVPTQAQAAT